MINFDQPLTNSFRSIQLKNISNADYGKLEFIEAIFQTLIDCNMHNSFLTTEFFSIGRIFIEF